MCVSVADIIGVVQELVNVPSNSDAKKVVVDVNLKDLKYGSYIFP